MEGLCALCDREEDLTRHHLIPRTRHHNRRNKRDFDRATVKETVGICRACHSQIHALLTEKEIELHYPTVERLRAHPELAKFILWIARRPSGLKPRTVKARRCS